MQEGEAWQQHQTQADNLSPRMQQHLDLLLHGSHSLLIGGHGFQRSLGGVHTHSLPQVCVEVGGNSLQLLWEKGEHVKLQADHLICER